MQSIKEAAKQHVATQTKNISELQSVSVDLALMDGKGTDKDGKEFTYKYIELDGECFRIPGKVLGDLKAILEKKPSLKTFSVSKKGQGLTTVYTVIPLD